MDRPRSARTPRRLWPLAAALLFAGAVAIALASFGSDAPAVDRDRLVVDAVKRGPFLREIAAPGALAAEQVRLIAAPAAGRVEEIHIEAGDAVKRGDPIVTLVNREATKELLKRFYPNVPVKREVEGREPLYSNRKAREVLGCTFRPFRETAAAMAAALREG